MDKHGLFEILIRQNAPSLRAFIRSIAFDRELVDDVFQETILAAWNQIESFDRSRPIGPWLRGIAKNCLLAASRKRRRMVLNDEVVVNEIERRFSSLDPEVEEANRSREALRECVGSLKSDEREAVELCYRQEMPANEAATIAHVSHDAMRKRLQRARANLLDCLERKGIAGLEA
ncbi:MAG: sigma-70 family RNA polymerase sigma factor [Phycisphaerae bacterium]|nr:sigma-70 family RNA polymerase sigma factor [Phycisphaerae bacterium]